MRPQSRMPSNPSLVEKKLSIGRELFNTFPTFQNFPFKLNCCLYGIPMGFRSFNRGVVEDIANSLPLGWIKEEENDYLINLFEPEETLSDHWNNETVESLMLYNLNSSQIVIHKDFVGIDHDGKNLTIVCKRSLGEDFLPLLKWLLPRIFLKRNSFLINVERVVESEGSVSLYLSPRESSNYIVLSEMKGEWFALQGLFNNNHLSNRTLGKQYPLSKVFWNEGLEKESKASSGKSSLLLFSKARTIFAPEDDESELKLLELIGSLVKKVDVYE